MPTKTASKAAKAPAKKAPAKKAPAAKAPTNKDKILDAAKSAGGPIDVKDLATAAGVSASAATKAVKVLEDEGKVTRDGTTVTAKTRVGRRSTEVVDRDQKILDEITAAGADGLSKAEIAEKVDTTERLTYESLWRLREQGKIARAGSTRSAKWVAA